MGGEKEEAIDLHIWFDQTLQFTSVSNFPYSSAFRTQRTGQGWSGAACDINVTNDGTSQSYSTCLGTNLARVSLGCERISKPAGQEGWEGPSLSRLGRECFTFSKRFDKIASCRRFLQSMETVAPSTWNYLELTEPGNERRLLRRFLVKNFADGYLDIWIPVLQGWNKLIFEVSSCESRASPNTRVSCTFSRPG